MFSGSNFKLHLFLSNRIVKRLGQTKVARILKAILFWDFFFSKKLPFFFFAFLFGVLVWLHDPVRKWRYFRQGTQNSKKKLRFGLVGHVTFNSWLSPLTLTNRCGQDERRTDERSRNPKKSTSKAQHEHFSALYLLSNHGTDQKLEMLGSIVSRLASPRKILGEKKFGWGVLPRTDRPPDDIAEWLVESLLCEQQGATKNTQEIMILLRCLFVCWYLSQHLDPVC